MPRFAISMERVRRETRTVIVEADDEQQATAIAVENDFDEAQLDDWDPLDPEEPEVFEVARVEDDRPLTPASPDCEETTSLLGQEPRRLRAGGALGAPAETGN